MAKRSGFDGVFLNGTTGLPLIGLDVAVYNSSGTTLSTIYTTKSGNTLKTNPFQTTSANAGLVQFWADPGYYEIQVSDTQNRISTRRIPFNAVAGDTSLGAEGIDVNQIDLTNLSNKIETGMLKDNAVTTAKIGNNQVTTGKIGDNQITTAKIANSQVTFDKISPQYQAAKLDSSLTVTGSQNQWVTVLTLSGLGSGVFAVNADFRAVVLPEVMEVGLWEGTSSLKNSILFYGDNYNYWGSLGYVFSITTGSITLRARGTDTGFSKSAFYEGTNLTAHRIG